MSYRNFRFAAGLLALLVDCCVGLTQDQVPGNPSASEEDANIVESHLPLHESLLDLDVDSDNNNGLEVPDGSEWEEQIETHEFSIGKLVETGASRFTPVLIRLNKKALQQPDGNNRFIHDLRVKLEIENARGVVRLWNKPQAENRDDGQGLLQTGESFPLKELNFDAATWIATIWIEAVTAVPGIDTKRAIDRNGRPDMFLRARLRGIEHRGPATDAVKYLPVDQDTFYPTLINRGNRHVRNSFPAILVNGLGGQSGTLHASPPEQSKTYGFRLMTEDELASVLAASNLSDIQRRYVAEVLYYKVSTFGNPGPLGVNGFRVGLYRDYNSGDYTLAFQYSLKDNCTEVFMNLGPRYFGGRAEGSHHRVAAMLLSAYLAGEKFGVKLPGLQLAGVGVGGDLAVFGAFGSGVHADTFNRKPFPEGMVKLILTQYDPRKKKRIEVVPGSLDRSQDAGELTTNYLLKNEPSFAYRVEREL